MNRLITGLMALALISLFGVRQVKAIVIADSVNDYSGVQGQAGWYYGYYDGTLTIDTFKQLPHYDGFGIQNNVTLGWSLQSGEGGFWTTTHKWGGHPNGTNGNQARLPVEQWAVRRWVSDISGPITISGSMGSINGGNMYTHVIIDGSEVFQHQVPNSDFNYDLNANVSVGSIVDFVISPNNHIDVNGDTKFTAIISSPVPEPSTLALLGMGAFGLLAWTWRRGKLDRILVCLIAFLVSTAGIASADVLNMGPGLTSLEMVNVGDPGNAGDTQVMTVDGTSGYGAVGYNYKIGKYEITAGQYTEFLNAVAVNSDPYDLYSDAMATNVISSKIIKNGSVYIATLPNQPVNNVSWGDMARFCNWMSNGQPKSGSENLSSTEDGSYYLNGKTGHEIDNVTRKANATWVIPNENEWYKAAYYDPNKPGGAGYWLYPTKSDIAPSNILSSTQTNNANYNRFYSPGGIPSPWTTDVGSFANSLSAYGTLDQAGNLFERTEPSIGRCVIRGGAVNSDPSGIASSERSPYLGSTDQASGLSFRVAFFTPVPEPRGILLLACGAISGLICWRRNRIAV